MQKTAAWLHTIVVRLTVLVLVLFMASVGTRIVTRHMLVDLLGMDNAFTRFILKDEPQVLAPSPVFSLGESTSREEGLWGILNSIHTKYTYLIQRVAHRLEVYVDEELIFRRPIVEAANSYEKRIGWNLAGYQEYNNVIDLGNGYLTTFMPWIDVWGNAEAVIEFNEYLDNQGIPLLFVQFPSKVPRNDTIVNNIVDFYNNNADRLVGLLRNYSIRTLDLRDNAERRDTNYRSLFYNTDHHWRTETGLWAAAIVGETLNKDLGFSTDLSVLDASKYRYETYEKSFLGSVGRKATLARAVPDDFSLLYPKFDVDLMLKIPAIALNETGDFSIIFDYSQLDIEDLYERDLYGMYLHSANINNDFISIVNNLNQGSKKLLVLGDSFSNTVVPYLGLTIKHTDAVDLRHYKGDLRNLIEQGDYDAIVIAYSVLYPAEYESGTSLYDFR